MIIYVLGNSDVKEDNAALRLAESLDIPGVEFNTIEALDDIMDPKAAVYLDVAEGIRKARLITDADDFLEFRRVSAHDMDFAYFLKLKKEMGELEDVKIIAVPMQNYKNLKQDVKDIVEGLK